MPANDLVQAVLQGEADDDFNAVNAALRKRQSYLADIQASAFSEGTRVQLANLRPKYLIGLTGTVLRKEGQKFVVELDAGQDTRRYDSILRVKPTMLEAA